MIHDDSQVENVKSVVLLNQYTLSFNYQLLLHYTSSTSFNITAFVKERVEYLRHIFWLKNSPPGVRQREGRTCVVGVLRTCLGEDTCVLSVSYVSCVCPKVS